MIYTQTHKVIASNLRANGYTIYGNAEKMVAYNNNTNDVPCFIAIHPIKPVLRVYLNKTVSRYYETQQGGEALYCVGVEDAVSLLATRKPAEKKGDILFEF